MKTSEPIQIVDLFAGPGGLGEGFSSFLDGSRFKIIVSAEMDPVAHSTLRLRAFYRILKNKKKSNLADYYRFCNGLSDKPFSKKSEEEWAEAEKEAHCITLGTKEGDEKLDKVLDESLDQSKPWVLIGGPPCQAYSLAGRSRNKGKANYSAEDDHRHFLYKDYLRIIQERQPTIFVMENVKGILSAKINGESIFKKIIEDLADPDKALGLGSAGKKYKICSFVSDHIYSSSVKNDSDLKKYIIRSELHGVPQARHRVILLGIAVNGGEEVPNYPKLEQEVPVSVEQAISGLPRIRSRLTRTLDSNTGWVDVIKSQYNALNEAFHEQVSEFSEFVSELNLSRHQFEKANLDVGALRVPRLSKDGKTGSKHLDKWYLDSKLKCWLNHDARGHMVSDLRRYLYSTLFTRVKGYSPRGHKEFNLPGLAPAHKNWETGKFSDRFRVQCAGTPATTVTSHISKDGHYFIHYDTIQCRSLSVREAARLQTFPDNYFFLGNRSQQYHQVGNAVPPLLAYKMAAIVSDVISEKFLGQGF
ncbi:MULTISPECIES: DNA cytosine methyltransferase [Pseudomonas syringae group]|uniref:DNA (cytosine-5-)-methyltransferase n=3 Tax=Pseudomonas syringae group TaxID=136849 RepID=A0AAD0GRN3_9PSED|nr:MULTISPECIES: DNA cytosine methyltransferase [Pseudomonas syringae group]AVB21501.1 DNA cytosine methyltransferase [Pseudomonas avellanae]EGH14284.1 modification methylase (cytosine-specific methyltransferase) [Pseudomonas amygdali pv. morsprunorum str. M302280]POP75442.1 DNA cytosine methyltransferase [Pseudomonas amygdali pv. morsprunorum]RML49915.1 Modification methylase [Pseudomonas amygdali pv. morsprunorum]SOS35452.1 modification methylase [Pseudomonas syringae group genomosp. 3]